MDYLSDRFGRIMAFQVGVGIFAIFSGISAAVENVEQLTVARFFAGIGIGGLSPVVTGYLAEFLPMKHRGRLMAFWAIFFPVGGLLASGVAALVIPTHGWRILFLTGITPAILVVLVPLLISESPRFLISKGRIEEARKAMRWLVGTSVLPAQLDETGTSKLVVENRHETRKVRAWVGALFAPGLRQRTIMIWTVWIGWSFSYFGLIIWLPSLLTKHMKVSGPELYTYIAAFLAAGIVGRIVVIGVIDRLGRTLTISICGLCAGVALVLFGFQTNLTLILLLGLTFSFFQEGGFSAIAPYTPELYPTNIRTTGIGWAMACGRVASILSPLAVGYLVSFGIEYVFIMFAIAYWCAAAAVLVLKIETGGQALTEIISSSS